jgi:hypothetical protein
MDTLPAVLLELNPPPPRFSTEAGGGRAGFLPRLAPRFHSGKQTRRVGRRTCGKTITQRVPGTRAPLGTKDVENELQSLKLCCRDVAAKLKGSIEAFYAGAADIQR